MMGNIITSVVNNQTTALQLSLSVLLNQKRKLVDQFHNFGITSSYNELRRKFHVPVLWQTYQG